MVALAASPDGTRRFRERHAARVAGAHFRTTPDDLTVASLGLGTYLGEPDDATDAAYADAIGAALALGANLVDTAANYRAQRSERVIGRTLADLFARGDVARDEVVLCSKAGYLPFDGRYPTDPSRFFYETYVKPGLLAPADMYDTVYHANDRGRALYTARILDLICATMKCQAR